MGVIDDIKTRLDIVDIVGEKVALRKTGRAYTGFCPFHHNTRTPAFTVYPDTQTFYCFGCQASGTVFDFVMRTQGIEFRDALQQLAKQAGVELRERTDEEQQQDHQRTRLLEITTLAARYFNYILLQHKRGQPGRDYLKQRSINQETIEIFQLGYSLNEWTHLLTYLTEKKGFRPDEVEQAGLAVRRDQGGIYDRFRGRLIFPIHNARGEIVGFGGRAIDTGAGAGTCTGIGADTDSSTPPQKTDYQPPKYLNTPQTLLFDKSQVLYGLPQARDGIRSNDGVVIVEGYIDVLTAHQHGFRNVVAPLGTALTGEHVRLLKRLTHNIYLALDADAAGQRATLRGIEKTQSAQDEQDDTMRPIVTAQGLVRWESDITLRIITMPAGKDPDDVIKTDPQQWKDLVASAVPVVDFYIAAYTANLDMSQAINQHTALERLTPILAQLDATQQRVYATHLESRIGIKAELILDNIRGRGAQQANKTRRQQAPPPQQPPAPPPQHAPSDPYLLERGYRAPPRVQPEDWLMALVLRYPATRTVIEQAIAHDLDMFPQVRELLDNKIERLLETTENRFIWQAWLAAGSPPLAMTDSDHPDSLVAWAQQLDSSLRIQVERLAMLDLPRPVQYRYMQDAETCARSLRKAQVRRWQRRLSQHATIEQDEAEGKRLMATLVELGRYMAFLDKPAPSKSFLDVRNTLDEYD
jgi:DNA primase